VAIHILTVDDSASIRKPLMRRIGQAAVTDAGSAEARDAIELMRAIERSRALESRTFDLLLANVVVANVEQPFTPETNQSTIGTFLT
jgi:hypothetical protein